MSLGRWTRSHAVVIVVDGNPGAITNFLEAAGVEHVRLRISPDDGETAEEVRRKLELPDPIPEWNVGKAIVERMRRGTTVILDNTRDCSTTTQISLQAAIDEMNYGSMMRPNEWRSCGNLLLVGAPPEMVYGRHAPLYGRTTSRAFCE